MAWPPIHDWMPNQPHATSARSIAGTCAPRTPNGARTKTGKGMPYFAPAWAFRIIGIRTMRLPSRMVRRLLPVHAARDQRRGQHVGGDLHRHGEPQRDVVVGAPGSLLRCGGARSDCRGGDRRAARRRRSTSPAPRHEWPLKIIAGDLAMQIPAASDRAHEASALDHSSPRENTWRRCP